MIKFDRTEKLIVTTIAVLGFMLAVYAYKFPPSGPGNNKMIFGLWVSSYSYPIRNGIVHVEGTTEYLGNGNYNFTGNISVSGSADSNSMVITYAVNGAGEWSGDKNSIFIKLMDTKSHVTDLRYDGKALDVNSLEKRSKKPLPSLGDYIPAGASDEFEIASISGSEMELLGEDPQGHQFKINMHKKHMKE